MKPNARRWFAALAGTVLSLLVAMPFIGVSTGFCSDRATLDVIVDTPVHDIWLDGNPLGNRSVTVPDLDPGEHKLRTVDSFGAEGNISFELGPGDIRRIIIRSMNPDPIASDGRYMDEIVLAQLTGDLLVYGDTPGVDVFLNGVAAGRTSLLLKEVVAGEYQVTAGHVERTVFVNPDALAICRISGLNPDEEDDIPEFQGAIIDFVGPEELSVFRDNEKLSGVPCSLGPFEEGLHQFEIRGDSIRPHALELAISPEHILVPIILSLTAQASVDYGVVSREETAIPRAYGTLYFMGPTGGEIVYLGDEYMGTTPLILNHVLAGPQKVKVGAVRDDIDVVPDQRLVILSEPSGINVKSVPESAAFLHLRTDHGIDLSIAVDGKASVKTPVSILQVGEGEHDIVITGQSIKRHHSSVDMAAYEVKTVLLSLEDAVRVESSANGAFNEFNEERLALARTYGELFFMGPEGGQAVLLDGTRRGYTPLILKRVTAGDHWVKVGNTADRVTLAADEKLVICVDGDGLSAGRMDTGRAFLFVTGPDSLALSIDGGNWEEMPMPVMRVNAGSHRIQARGEGFADLDYPINLTGGRLKVLAVEPEAQKEPSIILPHQVTSIMSRAYGALYVAGTEPGLDIHLDGVSVGRTTLMLQQVSQGAHIVEIRNRRRRIDILADTWTVVWYDVEKGDFLWVRETTDSPEAIVYKLIEERQHD